MEEKKFFDDFEPVKSLCNTPKLAKQKSEEKEFIQEKNQQKTVETFNLLSQQAKALIEELTKYKSSGDENNKGDPQKKSENNLSYISERARKILEEFKLSKIQKDEPKNNGEVKNSEFIENSEKASASAVTETCREPYKDNYVSCLYESQPPFKNETKMSDSIPAPLNQHFITDRHPFFKSTINNIKESSVEDTRESFLIQKNDFSSEITNEINMAKKEQETQKRETFLKKEELLLNEDGFSFNKSVDEIMRIRTSSIETQTSPIANKINLNRGSVQIETKKNFSSLHDSKLDSKIPHSKTQKSTKRSSINIKQKTPKSSQKLISSSNLASSSFHPVPLSSSHPPRSSIPSSAAASHPPTVQPPPPSTVSPSLHLLSPSSLRIPPSTSIPPPSCNIPSAYIPPLRTNKNFEEKIDSIINSCFSSFVNENGPSSPIKDKIIPKQKKNMNDQLNELFQKIQIEIDEKTSFLPPSSLLPPSFLPSSSSPHLSSSPPPLSSINAPPSSYPPHSNSSPPPVSSYNLPFHPPSSYSPPPSSLSNKKTHLPYRPSTPSQRLTQTFKNNRKASSSLASLNTSEKSRPSSIHAAPLSYPPPPSSYPPPPSSSYPPSYPPSYSGYPPPSYSPPQYPTHPPSYTPSYPPPSFYDPSSSLLPSSYPPPPCSSMLPSSYPPHPPPPSSSLNKQAIEDIVKQTTVEVLKNINSSFDHSLLLEEQLNSSFKNAKLSKIINNNSPPLLERPGLNENESIFIAKKKEILNQISYLDREILNMMNNEENESTREKNSFFSVEKEETKEKKKIETGYMHSKRVVSKNNVSKSLDPKRNIEERKYNTLKTPKSKDLHSTHLKKNETQQKEKIELQKRDEILSAKKILTPRGNLSTTSKQKMNSDFVERNKKWLEEKEQKNRQKEEKLKSEKIKECTFQPVLQKRALPTKKLDIKLIKNPKSQTKQAIGTLKVEIKKNEGGVKDKKELPENKKKIEIKNNSSSKAFKRGINDNKENKLKVPPRTGFERSKPKPPELKINTAPKAKQGVFQKHEKSSGLRTHETSLDEKQQANNNDHNQFLQDLIKQDLSKISKHVEEQGEESYQMQPVNGSKYTNEFLNNEEILDKEYASLLNDSNETQEIKNRMDKIMHSDEEDTDFQLLNYDKYSGILTKANNLTYQLSKIINEPQLLYQ